MTDYIHAQGSAEARRQNLIEQLGRGECPESVRQAIEDMLAEIATLKRKVLDNIQRHEDVEAQIRRDAGEQVRALREALERIQEVAAAAPHPRDVTKHDCDLCKVHKISDAALASTAPVAAKERAQAFWDEQSAWSQSTFGTDAERGPIGPLKHLEKEAKEAYEETVAAKQSVEIADCLFLTFDAARRSGLTLDRLLDVAFAKLERNKQRKWGISKPNEACEHVRTAPVAEAVKEEGDTPDCAACGMRKPINGAAYCEGCFMRRAIDERKQGGSK